MNPIPVEEFLTPGATEADRAMTPWWDRVVMRHVPKPRMEGGRPRPPHAGARLMDGWAACFSLNPYSCGARGRAPSMGLNEQHTFWNKSMVYPATFPWPNGVADLPGPAW